MKFSTAILCGGRSRRMGEDKAALNWKGTTLAAYKWRQFTGGTDGEVFFSVHSEVQKLRIRELVSDSAEAVSDCVPDCGPLGGILTSLRHCREELLFVTAIDMPYTDAVFARELAESMESDCDAVVPVSKDGRQQPLCAVYRKSCLPVLERQLDSGKYRVRDALAALKVKNVQASALRNGEKKLTNMNDQAAYRKNVQAAVPVYSLIAWSDTGKTTYLETLIPVLKKRGVRVAVIKHDGHDFDIDRGGSDSARFTGAGADVSAVFSDTHAAVMLNGPIEAEKLVFLISMSGTADLILTEGCKKGKWPKILLYRESSGKPMAADPDTCAAVVSDVEVETKAPVFALRDVEAVADFLLR